MHSPFRAAESGRATHTGGGASLPRSPLPHTGLLAVGVAVFGDPREPVVRIGTGSIGNPVLAPHVVDAVVAVAVVVEFAVREKHSCHLHRLDARPYPFEREPAQTDVMHDTANTSRGTRIAS